MPRLGHKKSRNGCKQCKARHVKCDENRPCSNCSRHGVLCSLIDPNAPPVPSQAQGGTANTVRKTPSKAQLVQQTKKEPSEESSSSQTASLGYVLNSPDESSPSSSSDSFPFITKFVYRRDNQPPNLWIQDLALMEHWINVVAHTLTQRDENKVLWRTQWTKAGIEHTFLMHEILAISALHLAATNPSQQSMYHALGIHHQDHALRGMRKVLGTITEANASALFATSVLITITVYASRGQDAMYPHTDNEGMPLASINSVIDDLVDIFQLIQGMGFVISTAQIHVIKGPFAPMLSENTRETPSQPMFPQLLERIPSLLYFLENECDLTEEYRRELVAFVALMRETLLHAMRPCQDNREAHFLFYWPLHLSPNYLSRLRAGDEAALAILMHWAVVLFAAEPRMWCLIGWGDRVVKAISDAVTSPMWRSAIEWPLRLVERHKSTPPQDEQEYVPLEGYEGAGIPSHGAGRQVTTWLHKLANEKPAI
ncbi:hypothetical protein DM02DRAFT_139248 [Periconia macrospinosa]|uniref:Zn(2)-C6 fungal-type domain-containing protein n=1 Tax=Periconia macrospinosa TaxID=97972 RepID=A0A2V1DCL3_9PLEO|nr:hypothetical protein DM02DRAFT_139248 [Periconia macrospinosa]